ncbi:ABC transporter permease [Verrucomicrobia bacterium LW23]|nr:ABC transporter permease [Verrucomicrobia bacterium LW23]
MDEPKPASVIASATAEPPPEPLPPPETQPGDIARERPPARALQWRSKVEALVIPCGAIAVALVLFGIFVWTQGANPFAVFASIYKAAFASTRSFENTLVRAAPIMLCALGTAIPLRLGMVVIGNEGALVMGGLMATAAGLLVVEAPALVVQLTMAGAGMVAGGTWLLIVGALKHYRGVNETISSLLMNFIGIALLNQAVNSWMKDPSSLNKPSSFPIPEEKMLTPLGTTDVHWGIVFGVVFCIVAYILIHKTTFGFQIRTIGANIRAAQLAGLAVGKVTLVTCFIAGAAPGLAGMVEVAAVHGVANESLNVWYGNAGILVAFLARQNALACIVVSVMLGGLLASGGILQRSHQLPDATILVFQGIVFLCILYSESLYGKFSIFQEKKS